MPNSKLVATLDSLCIGVARLGKEDQILLYGTIRELLNCDFGEPLHSLVFIGETHFMEEEVLQFYRVNSE